MYCFRITLCKWKLLSFLLLQENHPVIIKGISQDELCIVFVRQYYI